MNKSHQNYKDYTKGKSRLKNAVLQHPEGENKIMDLLNKEIKRDFWVKPFTDWQKLTTRK